MRKAIRTRRLEKVHQYGMDRIIDMTFGQDENEHHIICEFYAGGNIILTDKDYKIIATLRNYRSEEVQVVVGETYTVQHYHDIPERIDVAYIHSLINKEKENYKGTIKDYLAKEISLGLEMIEHVLVKAGINPKMKLSQYDNAVSEKLVEQLNEAFAFARVEDKSPGYIVMAKGKQSNELKEAVMFYDRFIPYLFAQFENSEYTQFDSFNEAVDEYYSKLELQRLEKQRLEREINATKKLENVKKDQEGRILKLEEDERLFDKMAQLIEENAEVVDMLIATINGYLASQISWPALKDLIKQEQKKGNPLAALVHSLKLEKNLVTILLYSPYEEGEEDAQLIDIDLAKTAHANVADYFKKRKDAKEKRMKTVEASQKAYKSAEKKAYSELKEVGSKVTIHQIRKQYWFEKFNWFFSSDGYIVVSGRDMQQNEQLYKKYLQKGDLYVHADIHGASTCIIKNPSGEPVPPRTLNEAGSMSICYSHGWKNKIVASAWWVEEHQVSKTAPSGEYLSTGSFMIRGKKNFLPPSNLVMGMGILFKLAEESIPSHVVEQSEEDIRKEKERKRDELQKEQQIRFGETEQDGEHEKNIEEQKELNKDETKDPTSIDTEENSDVKDNGEIDIDIDGNEIDDKESNESEGDSHDTKEFVDESQNYAIDLDRDDDFNEEDLLEDMNSEEDQQSVSSGSDVLKKKRIPRHQRKQMKKGNVGQEKGPQPSKKKNPENKEKQPQPPQLSKRAKNKMKKIKQKYKYQDEEERRVAMEILASSKKKDSEAPSKEDLEAQRIEAIKKRQEHKSRIRQREIEKGKEEEEIRRLLREENLEILSDDALAKIKESSTKALGINIKSFTPAPKPNDILLYAMAVCAPYEALSDYKYRVKITPGTLKKGKAANLALHIYLQNSDLSDLEKELIKAIPEAEMTQVMISNGKIQAPGLQNLLSQRKKKKAKS